MERERLAPLSLEIEKRGRCMRPGCVNCGREGEEREEPSSGLPWGRGGGEGEEGVSEGEKWGIRCDVPSTSQCRSIRVTFSACMEDQRHEKELQLYA
jgi:hypothetical protein